MATRTTNELIDRIHRILEQHKGDMQDVIHATAHHLFRSLQMRMLYEGNYDDNRLVDEVTSLMHRYLEVNPVDPIKLSS